MATGQYELLKFVKSDQPCHVLLSAVIMQLDHDNKILHIVTTITEEEHTYVPTTLHISPSEAMSNGVAIMRI